MTAMMHPDGELEHLLSHPVSEYETHGKLALPNILMGHVWPEHEDAPDDDVRALRVLDINWKPRRFICRLRRNEQGNPVAEVYGPEWRSFINQKKMRVGDELAFYQPPPLNWPPNEAPVFVISVKRQIRVCGVTMSDHIRL